MSSLALRLACVLGATAAATDVDTARRSLQDSTCSPTDAELATVINIVMAAQTKLEAQTAAVACLRGCIGGGSCTCGGGISGGFGPQPGGGGQPGGSISIIVDPDYAAALGSADALADCYLSPEEIANDPEAQALRDNFILATAAQLGVDPSVIQLQGLHTDGDTTIGCAFGSEPGTVPGGHTIVVDNAYASALGSDGAFDDCFLTPEEIAADPQAAAFALAYRQTVATELGVPVDQIVLNGISTSGNSGPGCGDGGTANGGMTINVNSDFANALGDDNNALDDCYLTAEEIAADPEAAALADQLRAVLAAQLGVPASQIDMTGFSTDGDNIPGCADTPAVGHTLDVTVDPDYASVLGSDSAFADCYLSSSEIATDPEAAAFAAAFIAQTAEELGVEPSSIVLNGISTDGDTTPGCNAAAGRRLQEGDTTTMANPKTVELLRSLAK